MAARQSHFNPFLMAFLACFSNYAENFAKDLQPFIAQLSTGLGYAVMQGVCQRRLLITFFRQLLQQCKGGYQASHRFEPISRIITPQSS